ncbi:MAG TPA: hypothetical protein ENJ32_03515 [Crenotrichaceae bacterium]|nr:hypothetical protein [Crenotrichaceae bacterium]
MRQETQGIINGFALLVTAGIAIFALTLPATRYVVSYLDPFLVGLGRFVFAGFIAAMIVTALKVPVPTQNQVVQLIIVALWASHSVQRWQ